MTHSLLTPVERHGEIWMKRDDLYCIAGQWGGKARTAFHLATTPDIPKGGLITAGSRQSPQVNIVAHIAASFGIGCTFFTPGGPQTPEIREALDAGAHRVVVRPGYNTHLSFRARRLAERKGSDWREIPFGMETREAVTQTKAQVRNIPVQWVKRIVIPLGSGMSAAGVLEGLEDNGFDIPVLGILVGADPTPRLDKYAPPLWRFQMEMVGDTRHYHKPATECMYDGVMLDPHYEAKCIPYLEPGDLLWVVGLRSSNVKGTR